MVCTKTCDLTILLQSFCKRTSTIDLNIELDKDVNGLDLTVHIFAF